MSSPFSAALAALPPDLFELFHEALQHYLGLASAFWRDARGVAAQLMASRDAAPGEGLAPERIADLQTRLGETLARWEGVDGAWREFQGASEVVVAEAAVADQPVLRRRLNKLRWDHESQAAGLQVLIDLATLVSGLDEGIPGPPVAEA